MKQSRISQIIFIFLFLGAIVLSSCRTGQETSSAQNGPGSVSQTDETGNGNQTGETVENETMVGVEEPTTSNVIENGATLILVADKVTTLDPYQMVSVHPDGSVASHLWDTLTLLNDDLQIEPNLAESWRLVNNFTWEFKLREGISFHNGELLNAEAVRFSIERAQSMPGSLETFAEDVNLSQVEVTDEYTFQLITREPVVNLPYHLAFLEILPPLYYSETSPDRLRNNPEGSGPYRLSEWTDNEIVLEAVSDYWKGTPILSYLVFRTIPEVEQRLAALQNNEVVLVTDLPPIRIDDWNSTIGRLEAVESTQRMFIGIPIEEGSPLADKRIRQALNYGVNVEQIVDDWLEGYGEHYGSWVNPPSHNTELTPWPYDPQKARDLLAEAGYGETISLTLRTPVDVYYHDVDIAETIAQQLNQVGVTIKVEPVSNWGIYTRDLLTGRTDTLFLLGLNSRGNGLEDVKELSAGFIFNPTGWKNESFEEVLSRAANTFNEDARGKILNEAQSIAYEEAVWIWLWRQYDFYGVSQSLEWTPRRDGLVYLYTPVAIPSENDQ